MKQPHEGRVVLPPLKSNVWPLPDEAAVAAATTVRAEILAEIARLIRAYTQLNPTPDMPPLWRLGETITTHKLAFAAAQLADQTSAEWWLAQRDADPLMILTAAITQAPETSQFASNAPEGWERVIENIINLFTKLAEKPGYTKRD